MPRASNRTSTAAPLNQDAGPSSVLPGLMRGAVAALVGDRGCGKSSWAFQAGYAMLTGQDLLGWAPEPGPVGLVTFDESSDTLKRRMGALRHRFGMTVEEAGFHRVRLTGLAFSEPQQLLDLLCEAFEGSQLVIVDAFDKLVHLAGEPSCDLAPILCALAQRLNCGVLYTAWAPDPWTLPADVRSARTVYFLETTSEGFRLKPLYAPDLTPGALHANYRQFPDGLLRAVDAEGRELPQQDELS